MASSSARRPLMVFFVLAFGLSWAVWVPAALASHGIVSIQISPSLSGLLGVFGPFVAAVLCLVVFEGRAGVRALGRRLVLWRVSVSWYGFVLLWPPVLSLAKTAIAVWLGAATPDFSQPPFVEVYPLPPELLGTRPFQLDRSAASSLGRTE